MRVQSRRATAGTLKVRAKKLPKRKTESTYTFTKQKQTRFRPLILSRHPSHRSLREDLPLLPFRSVVRLGSTTPKPGRIECNSSQACATSANKRLMKQAFDHGHVVTARWAVFTTGTAPQFVERIQRDFRAGGDRGFIPVVSKQVHGSRGRGNRLHKTIAELTAFVARAGHTDQYVYEKFYNFSREYRLHVTHAGVFYACRKMLKEETPDANRWYRNDSNCSWIIETNPQFDRPSNWTTIVEECIKACRAVGLDFSGVDVKVQSRTTEGGRVRTNPEFIVIETNSAPSFGDITLTKYLQEIPRILREKFVAVKSSR